MPTVECPKCEANLDAPAEYMGRNVRCAKCGHSFILRFSGHDMHTISVKVAERPPAKDDESTIVFLPPDGIKPDSTVQQKAPATEKPGEETRDKA
jgi:DNA-directed RNA polymerase subunit M/transcription elongation factor TFIIS